MSALSGINKAKARRQSHHKDTKKYAKQTARTLKNKIKARLFNAAGNDRGLLAQFMQTKGGSKKVLSYAENEVTQQEFISELTATHIRAAEEALNRNN